MFVKSLCLLGTTGRDLRRPYREERWQADIRKVPQQLDSIKPTTYNLGDTAGLLLSLVVWLVRVAPTPLRLSPLSNQPSTG